MDTLSPGQRSAVMARVRGKNTKPEMVVRRLVWTLGYRYRLYDRSLPGTPDLVFRARKKAVFVHGCFWHRHACHRGMSMPESRVGFWTEKFLSNRRRDAEARDRLRQIGWDVLVIWECQLRNSTRLAERVICFLEGGTTRGRAQSKADRGRGMAKRRPGVTRHRP